MCETVLLINAVKMALDIECVLILVEPRAQHGNFSIECNKTWPKVRK